MFNFVRSPLFVVLAALLFTPAIADAQACIERIDGESGIYREGVYAQPVQFLASYFTQITERDIVNSSGARLSGFRQIIQQDRANVNKYNKPDFVLMSDGETDENGNFIEWKLFDKKDPFFVTPQRRALLQTMPLIFACGDDGLPRNSENSADFKFWTDAIEIGQVPGSLGLIVFPLPQGGYGFHFSFAG